MLSTIVDTLFFRLRTICQENINNILDKLGAKSVDSHLVGCILQPKSGMKWVKMDDMNSTHDSHEPVLVEEIMFWLQCKPGGVYVDCTLGYAGLASHILDRTAPDGILVGIDRDAAALA